MIRVDLLDRRDEATFTEAVEVYAEANERDIDQPWHSDELRVLFAGDEYVRTVPVVARDADQIAGLGWIDLPQRDNTDTAYVEIFVPPRRRRRGIGSVLLGRFIELARAEGRKRLLVETLRPAADAVSPGSEFARAHGFELDTVNAQRELSLPRELVPGDARAGYRLVAWRGVPPEQWIDQYAVLRSLLNQEAPSGVTELENEYWDADRIRADVAHWHQQGRTGQTVVAVAPDGSLAGHTQLLFPRVGPEVYQWDTLVLPVHRGHRLGLAMKQQAMLESADLLAGRRRIVTWNDATNTPMIDVNEALGYRLTAYGDQFFRTL